MKKIFYIFPLLATVLLVACEQKNTPSPAPKWQAEAETLSEAPHWAVSNTSLYPSSMTITAELPVNYGSYFDTVAALLCSNDEVLGVCANEGEDHFALYVHGPQSDTYYKAFRLCYYSDGEKQLYVSYAEDNMLFVNDAVIGTAVSPKQFTWVPCGTHNKVCRVLVESMQGNWHKGDELALFVGESCRYAVRPFETDAQSQRCELWLPYDTDGEVAECRYYNAATEKVSATRLSADVYASTIRVFAD